MVQVDVFWTYALGATAAVAASRQIETEEREEPIEWWQSPYFVKTLLFLAIGFAPSGVCLLWAFPSWETMHAGDRNLPAWLVTGFAATNITQGILGYWVARRLVLAGRRYAAFLQVLLGYLAMFFILVHGWDGSGYRRFFSPTRQAFLEWTPATIGEWITSDVAITLGLLGVLMVPVLLAWYGRWLRDGNPRLARARSGLSLSAELFGLVVALGLGGAILASVSVRLLGWLPGLLAFAALGGFALARHGGPAARLYRHLGLADEASPPLTDGEAALPLGSRAA